MQTRKQVGDAGYLVKCNHCKEFVLDAHRMMHAIDCRKRRNTKKLEQLTFAKGGKSLYAIHVIRRKAGEWIPETDYVHADDIKHARAQFWLGEPDAKSVRVVEIGLAIGTFQDQSTGVISL